MTELIEKIVVVGRDAEAWISAFFLHRNLAQGDRKVEVELLELPSDLTDQDFFSVLPSHKVLHEMLGAKENALLRFSNGMFSFGQRFSNWAGNGTSYLHAFDRFGVDFEGVNFFHYWLRATSSGLKVPLDEFNLGAVASKLGRYVVFDEVANTFSHASYGYNLDSKSYIRSIARAALNAGLKHRPAAINQIKVESGNIKAIVLADGSEVVADYFVDASGADAILIRQLEKDNIENWSKNLPIDRLIVATAQSLEPLPSFNQITAFAEGWAGFFPLIGRTGVQIAYSSEYTSSVEVIERVSAMSGLKLNNPTAAQFSSGVRKRHWIGNCIAIGATSINLEPLDTTQLHTLHVGLSLLRSLLPETRHSEYESTTYNEKMTNYLNNLRDYTVGHYALNKRYGDKFWDDIRRVNVSEALAKKISLFKSRGLICMQEDETFQEEDWISLFVGHNLIPETYDPMVYKLDDEALMLSFQQLLAHIKKEVEQMPSLQAHVEMTLL